MSEPKPPKGPSKRNIVYVTIDPSHPAYRSCTLATQVIHSDPSLETDTLLWNVAKVRRETLDSLGARELPILITEELDIDPRVYAEYISVMSNEGSSNAQREKMHSIVRGAKTRFAIYSGLNAVLMLRSKVNQEVLQGLSTGYRQKSSGHVYKARFAYDSVSDQTLDSAMAGREVTTGRYSLAFDAMNSDTFGENLDAGTEKVGANFRRK